MLLTRENAHEYEGKLIDSSTMGHHYYPLKVEKHPTLGWRYVDRFGVSMEIPVLGIYFDSVTEEREDG